MADGLPRSCEGVIVYYGVFFLPYSEPQTVNCDVSTNKPFVPEIATKKLSSACVVVNDTAVVVLAKLQAVAVSLRQS